MRLSISFPPILRAIPQKQVAPRSILVPESCDTFQLTGDSSLEEDGEHENSGVESLLRHDVRSTLHFQACHVTENNSTCPAPVSSDVRELIATLSAIPEAIQRSHALAERLKDLEDDAILEAIRIICEKTLAGDEDFLRLYNGLIVSGILAQVLGSARMSRLVHRAQDVGAYQIVSILLDLPPEHPSGSAFRSSVGPDLTDIPLGVRKALARKPDFRSIERLARDPDPRVIRNLLKNPKLTERLVIGIAATRPGNADVLEEIYNHPKWIARYDVKKTLVMNPHTPRSIALKLLVFMKLPDLEEIQEAPNLPEIVKSEARKIVDRKTVYHFESRGD